MRVHLWLLLVFLPLRNRIIAPFGKRMATGDAAQGQSEGECKGVAAEGFEGVVQRRW